MWERILLQPSVLTVLEGRKYIMLFGGRKVPSNWEDRQNTTDFREGGYLQCRDGGRTWEEEEWGCGEGMIPETRIPGEETCGSKDPKVINGDICTEKRELKGRWWGLRSESKAVPRSQEASERQAKAFILFPAERTQNRNNSVQGRVATKGLNPVTI